jgi:BRCT domain, a BRCA1 C-terminus domain
MQSYVILFHLILNLMLTSNKISMAYEKIFTRKYKPKRFFIENFKAKDDLEKLIEFYGGKIDKTPSRNNITLIAFKNTLPEDFYYESPRTAYYADFITESIAKGQVLPIRNYKYESKVFSEYERSLMIAYASNNEGNPCSLSYWASANQKTRVFNSSANRLRQKWMKIIKPHKSANYIALFQRTYSLALKSLEDTSS